MAAVFRILEGWHRKSVEQIRLRWRSGLRQYHRFGQCGLLVQVGEYLVDDQEIFDTGDDFGRTTTLGAGFYVNY